ncbi:hypothetical protein [Undibacterium sp. TJN19]|uniref:hypothetical protein n=1 Tax=Undibacterium sp. TJN19 TaxID=3413055 RepID=UPI003BF4ECD0
MRNILFFVCLVLTSVASMANTGNYQSVSISADQRILTITQAGKEIHAPTTEPEQQGFQDAQISGDAQMLGWLALTKNCCTSYPLPTSLVIFKNGKLLQRFDDVPPIWQWQFAFDNTAVAYRQGYPHGLLPITYKLRSLKDGKVLATFICMPNENKKEDSAPDYLFKTPVPAWVKSIADECPVAGTASSTPKIK